MKLFTFLGLLLLFNSVALVSSSQTVISTETFPNPFNTDYISPVNQGFNEDIGQWAGYSTDAYSAAAVDDQYRVTDPFSLKLINRQTSKGTQQSVASATSPIITCTSTCVTSLSLNFKINPVNVNADNSFYKFYVDVSSDNGLTWTTMIVKTAADIANSYGTRKWNDVTIQIPSQFFTSSFRYRFVGVQQAGCNYDNWLYIDDVKVIATPCTATGNLTLGNQVWNDRDGDGKRDDNEPAIGGATISLYTDNDSDNLPDGAAIKTTQSDAQGIYHFTNLAPGRYIVSMPILPGYQQSPNKSTQATSPFPDNNVDNDDNLVRRVGPNGPGGILYTNAITLTEGQEPDDNGNTNNTLDLAECGNSWIGDFVWNDLNGNGIQDAGEPGINGVKVTITFEDGRTATDITHTYNAANNQNAPQYDGYYDFKNLGPGTYKITFETPAGFTASPALQGPDRAKDSNPINGTTSTTLAANQSDFTIDAGFTNNAPATGNLSLGNQVWNDRDGDGKRDDNEPAIGGATISLYTDNDSDNLPDGAAIKTTQSDAQGIYHFTNLAPGRYIVSMPILPGYQQSPNKSTQATSPFPDNNVDNDDNLVRRVGPNGPGGILYTNAITLTEGQEPDDNGNTNNTLDLAECGNSWIGDFVWNDLNGNGIQDAGEPGINGVKVTITFEDGRTATDITHTYNAANNQNAPQYDGYYDFKNLGPGTYKITFETPAGFTASPALQGPDRAKDSNPINGTTSTTLAANQSDFTIDAGFTNNASLPPSTCPNLSVGNMVFNDLNGDGKKQPAEPGIGGLTVNLYADSDGNNVADDAPISTLVTAEDGTYYFGNLGAGKYIVGVAIDKNYALGANADLTPDDNKDNDNNGARMINGEVQSNYITLSPGDEPINDGSDNNSNLTLDFGLKIVCDNHCNCHNDCNHTGCGHPNCGQRSDKDCPGATTTAGYFGGFEAGAANFSSSTGNTDLRYGLPRNGSYEIVEKAKDAGGGGYLKTVAHSGSKMMVLHSSFNANCRLWSTTMNVIPGKTYTFCVWVANVKQDPVNGFALTLNAGNTIIAAASADFNWSRICGTYTVPDGVTSVEFSIKDPFPEIGASHFLALDDICIATTNAPAGSTDQSRSATASPVYPNPAGTYFNLNLTASKASTAEIRLINMNGKTIFRETRQVVKGLNSILIDRIKNVTGGTYNVQILIDGQVINQTLIISR
jgi:hypothetical protein